MPEQNHLPGFLIIGAMKAGTTTLWSNLRSHPQIFMPESKEPETLRFADAATTKGRRRYASLFRAAQPNQLCGEASTLYTKLPYSRDIARRAIELLGPDLKLIYQVRDPLRRAQSHHRHLWLERKAGPDFDNAMRDFPEIVDYSCYATQIEPWLAHFGPENLLVVKFEDLITARVPVLAEIARFLGLSQTRWSTDAQSRLKPGDAATTLRLPFANEWFYRMRMTHTYKWLSESPAFTRAKGPIKRLFQQPAPATKPRPPSPQALAHLARRFEPEIARFTELTGTTAPEWTRRAESREPAPHA